MTPFTDLDLYSLHLLVVNEQSENSQENMLAKDIESLVFLFTLITQLSFMNRLVAHNHVLSAH